MRTRFPAAPALTLALSLTLTAGILPAADDDVPKGLEAVQGAWKLTRLFANGKDIGAPRNATLEVKGDKFTFRNGDVTQKGTYKVVDPDGKPLAVDIEFTEGQ